MGSESQAGISWHLWEGKKSGLGWVDTCLELPLLSSHKAHFLDQLSPGDVRDPPEPPAQWATQPEWKETARPVNPRSFEC